MAFWSKWFAPKCSECTDPMVDEKKRFDGRDVCETCHTKLVADKAAADQVLEEQRQVQDATRKRLEDGAVWGSRD